MICELREKHSLDLLLQISGIPRSTYYYWVKYFEDNANKDHELLSFIIEIFQKNHRKYGYPRITQELKSRGYTVNKKRVARLMKETACRPAQESENIILTRVSLARLRQIFCSRTFRLMPLIKSWARM